MSESLLFAAIFIGEHNARAAPGGARLTLKIRGVPRWCDRFTQYGIKVSFWGSGPLKIVIPVENHPQKPKNRLADYHPLWGWGGVN